MPDRRSAVLIPGLVTAVLLVGCGGSDFASKANDICKKYTAKIRSTPQPSTSSDLPVYLDRVTTLVTDGTAKLRALKPPSSKQAAYQQYLSLLDQEVALTQQADTAAKRGDTNTATSLIQQLSPLSDRDKASAKALGLAQCAK
jgi:hypothetical protein